jgi:hypothetical protein
LAEANTGPLLLIPTLIKAVEDACVVADEWVFLLLSTLSLMQENCQLLIIIFRSFIAPAWSRTLKKRIPDVYTLYSWARQTSSHFEIMVRCEEQMADLNRE